MTAPFVSIVICSRNRLKSLQRYALPSIETIDYPSFEVVIVDDASTDGTWEFLQDHQLRQAPLKAVRNKKAKGLCNARNVGIANSSGEIIAFQTCLSLM
jgi:glycosyltransferase involved in cell wall biosynthesis